MGLLFLYCVGEAFYHFSGLVAFSQYCEMIQALLPLSLICLRFLIWATKSHVFSPINAIVVDKMQCNEMKINLTPSHCSVM